MVVGRFAVEPFLASTTLLLDAVTCTGQNPKSHTPGSMDVMHLDADSYLAGCRQCSRCKIDEWCLTLPMPKTASPHASTSTQGKGSMINKQSAPEHTGLLLSYIPCIPALVPCCTAGGVVINRRPLCLAAGMRICISSVYFCIACTFLISVYVCSGALQHMK